MADARCAHRRRLRSVAEGLAVFSNEWEFNPGLWKLLAHLVGVAFANRLVALAVIAVALLCAWRSDDSAEALARSVFWVLAATIVLSPTVMPWYLPWALPAAILIGNRSWIALTALSLLSYLIYIDQVERTWWLVVEHGAFWLLLIWECGKSLASNISRA